MAVRIIEIAPRVPLIPADKVLAHLSIKNFKWINEQSLQTGVSSLEIMFDWIVNKKGVAYIRKSDITIPVFGALSPTGQPYLRCVNDKKWSDELLGLPQIT